MNSRNNFRFWTGALAVLVMLGVATAGVAQSYPAKPLRLVLPYPPGVKP